MVSSKVQLLQMQGKDQEAAEKKTQATGFLSPQVQPLLPLSGVGIAGHPPLLPAAEPRSGAEGSLSSAHLGTALPNQPDGLDVTSVMNTKGKNRTYKQLNSEAISPPRCAAEASPPRMTGS